MFLTLMVCIMLLKREVRLENNVKPAIPERDSVEQGVYQPFNEVCLSSYDI
jgi:hypothetical protein